MMVNRIAIFTIISMVLGIMVFVTKVSKKEDISDATNYQEEIENYGPIVVLELFTSRCSSCPPADALLEKVKKDFSQVVFSLSYHVDYWNYIGWKDSFGKPQNTKKQWAYNLKFGNRTNYTPQVVIREGTFLGFKFGQDACEN